MSRVLLFAAEDSTSLRRKLEDAAAQVEDAGVERLADSLAGASFAGAASRAAVVAATAGQCTLRTQRAGQLLEAGGTRIAADRGVFVGTGGERARVGFMFPGQGAPVSADRGAIARQFPEAAQVQQLARLPDSGESVPPALVQLSIVAASVAALRAVSALGVEAELAVGHSLGELTALHWAGALDEEALLYLARARGEAMTYYAAQTGTMARLAGPQLEIEQLVANQPVTLACHNAPTQHVVSGSTEAVHAAMEAAREQGFEATELEVQGAFHSPLMEPAVPVFARALESVALESPTRRVVSTVTGTTLAPEADLRSLLRRQILEPVRFVEAARESADHTDLLIEVGPGKILARLVGEIAEIPAVSMRAEAASADGLLETAAAAFVAGADVRFDRLSATAVGHAA